MKGYDFLKDSRLNDLEELSEHDMEFYRNPHGNSLDTLKETSGYSLRDLDTGEIVKYGETTRGLKRYSPAELRQLNAEIIIEKTGSKIEMKRWETTSIKTFEKMHGRLPKYNQGYH